MQAMTTRGENALGSRTQAPNKRANIDLLLVEDVVDETRYSGPKPKLYILRYDGPWLPHPLRSRADSIRVVMRRVGTKMGTNRVGRVATSSGGLRLNSSVKWLILTNDCGEKRPIPHPRPDARKPGPKQTSTQGDCGHQNGH